MASHLISYFTQCLALFLLLSHIAANAVVADSRPRPRRDDFPNEKLYRTYSVIQRFRSTITSDPENITRTWTGHDICGKTSYLGFYCSVLTDGALTVTSVVFDGYGLRAPKLQGFVDELPDLALFMSSSNSFAGDVPRLAALPYMYKLHVVENDLHPQRDDITQSNIVVAVGIQVDIKLPPTDLTVGSMAVESGTDNNGVMPGATNGRAILLNGNDLSGPLPADLGFTKVSYLSLASNKFTGPIPPSIAHAQDSLLEMILLNNQLSGCLPRELGLLAKAVVIDAGMNQITGSIPASFSCLSNVEQLNLAGNRLYGEVPDTLCHLAGLGGRLANLSLSSNYFTSVGPACSELAKSGMLGVKNNCIPGYADQRPPKECALFMRRSKTCPVSTDVSCRVRDNVAKVTVDHVVTVAPEGGRGRTYSGYVTYATLLNA